MLALQRFSRSRVNKHGADSLSARQADWKPAPRRFSRRSVIFLQQKLKETDEEF